MSTTHRLAIAATVAALVSGTAVAAEVGTLTLPTTVGVHVAQVQGAIAPRPTVDPVVRRAQEALRAARFDPGPIDGVMGARTRAAIRAFQTARRLAPSGELDNATRAALGI
jgi:hypothetical protein